MIGMQELLLSYGFCLDIENNPDDYFPIKLNFDNDPIRLRKEAVLNRLELLPYKNLFFLRHSDLVPTSLIGCLRVLVANEHDLRKIEKISGPEELLHNSVSCENELLVWDTLTSLLQAKYSNMDSKSPKEFNSPTNSFRLRMAKVYRQGQMDICAKSLSTCANSLASYFGNAVQNLMVYPLSYLEDETEFWDATQNLMELVGSDWDPEDWMIVFLTWCLNAAPERFPMRWTSNCNDKEVHAGEILHLTSFLCTEQTPKTIRMESKDIRNVYRWALPRLLRIANIHADREEADDIEMSGSETVDTDQLLVLVLA
jgi:hypothetical protein